MSDIEVSGLSRIEYESRSLARHIGCQHRGSRAQLDRPPCTTMLRYVTVLSAE